MNNPGSRPPIPQEDPIMTDDHAPEITGAKLALVARWALTVAGSLLAAHGLIGPHNTITPERWEFIVGAVITAAPLVWGWWEKARLLKTWRERFALALQMGVSAGINLTAAGQAVTTNLTPIAASADAPPLQPTPASAAAIVKAYAPPALTAAPGATKAVSEALRAAGGKP